ncbi:MAG TPA: TonB-dependent receptor [Bryobacteraceae bacterium]|nr:TonB-dependent receptor [Bryobacteraceae bacterium]
MFRFLICIAVFAALAFAQTASITGRITDPGGAVVPDAEVSAQSVGTGVTTSTRSNADGYYSVNALLPGKYNLTVLKAGFAPIKQEGLELEVQQIARLDFKLQVGAITQSVDVNAQAVVLESQTATTGQVVESKQITELPLLGRNPYALAMLVPGVRPSIGVNNLPIDQISTVSFAINGQRASSNEFLLDGAPNSAPSQNQPVINATPDLVQEFKVETSNYSAEYGRAAGGVFNVVTRSGTNDFHGSLYEFFRNDKLNANDFFANRGGNARAPFKYNQFGGTLGGPVLLPKIYNGKNRTFFFVSVEKVRFIQGMTFVGTEPTPQQLAGDFSNARNASGQLITIYDPATTTPNGSGGYTRSAFPGNIIPASRINPVSLAISKYIPAPNQAGALFTGVGNYSRVDANRINKDTVSYKVDHYFTENNRFFARYSADDTPDVRAAAYGVDNPASPSAGPQIFGRRNSVVEDTQTFSPTWLATIRYSLTRLSNFRTPFSNGFDITKLGLPSSLAAQLFPHAFPDVTITGESITGSIPNIITGGLLGATDQITLGNTVHALQGTTTKEWGNHEFKMGGEFRVIQLNNQQTGANSPVFNFTPAWTQGPNPTTASAISGLGVATFLLGIPTGTAQPVPAIALTGKYYGLFVQDSFKITPRFTLNYGLRWEYSTPRTDRFNELTNFDYSAVPPINAPGLNLHGALSFVGVNGVPRYQSNPDRNNIAPRLGFAYRLGDKTVIRGGAGIFYADNWGVGTGSAAFGSAGFVANTSIVTSLDGVTPIVSMSNPFPNGLVQPTGSKLGPATLLGQTIDFYDRGNATPYSGSWTLNIQRQLPKSVLLEVGYTGSRGLKFPFGVQLNQIPDADLALGNALRNQVANPFYGQISGGILSSPTVGYAQLLRPYPQFDTVTSDLANLANSTYHALEVKIEKRYSHGLTIMGSYTYSKDIDLNIGTFSGDSISAGVIQDYNNLKGEYAPSALDQTHRIIANAVYELPFFKSRHGFTGRALGGWEVGAILSMFSGSPLGISEATSTTFAQGGNQRPNWTGVSAKLSNPTVDQWFDTSQFTLAAPYTFGNVARTLSGLRSDRLQQIDMTLSKTTTIRERLDLQFRAECFNVTNTPQFSPPNTALGGAGFGAISSQNNQPRIVQLALKLLF